MAGQFDGKVALVTGASSGIGRAAALAFAREGAKVVIGNRRIPEGEETIHLIKDAGGEAMFLATDVTVTAQVEALVKGALAAYGRLDCAFNNAGWGEGGILTHELSEEHWHRALAVNLTGTWLCMKFELASMLQQGAGAIVNMSSIGGLVGARGGGAAYGAAKHGIVGLTKTAALEYAQAGIRVNAVCPGVVDTPIWENATPERRALLRSRQPLGREGTPEEVAATVLWLCSQAASLVTGIAMPVDGGFTAQ